MKRFFICAMIPVITLLNGMEQSNQPSNNVPSTPPQQALPLPAPQQKELYEIARRARTVVHLTTATIRPGVRRSLNFGARTNTNPRAQRRLNFNNVPNNQHLHDSSNHGG